MKPSWKDGFELGHEHTLGAESPRCCLFMAPLQRAGEQLSKRRWRQKRKDKTRRRHFPPASPEPWKDLTKVLGRALSLQKLKQELLAHQLSSVRLQVAQHLDPSVLIPTGLGAPPGAKNRDVRRIPAGRAAPERWKHLLAGVNISQQCKQQQVAFSW